MIRAPLATIALLSACGTAELPEGPSAAAGPSAGAAIDHATFLAELETWRQERDEGLRRDDGWLSLAGLYWLEPGVHRFGSAADNELVFPESSSPPLLGELTVGAGAVVVRAAPGVELTVAGEPAAEAELASDADGDPTPVEHGSLLFYVVARGDRLALRLKDRASPLLASFPGMSYHPPDPAWRVVARFEPYDPPTTILVPNITGTPLEETCPGRAVFEVDGQSYALEPTGLPGERLFFVFGDATNGKTTYGGGRFLYADWPEDDAVVLDFNRAYNPPCVFTPWATCPLPPPQNRLPIAIAAGELTYVGSEAAAH
ncbi:MAG: DUF1684 domain-containing protein [Thermoanaerobaculia bacterium]|nr:DUF1684 domain-containing protein [Thermoanaerobaculia bacterium]